MMKAAFPADFNFWANRNATSLSSSTVEFMTIPKLWVLGETFSRIAHLKSRLGELKIAFTIGTFSSFPGDLV